ncbi:MAG: Rrf2 family transcriptional regulator [Elusimicrobiota bacterium]|jgi:Rrf2 family protein
MRITSSVEYATRVMVRLSMLKENETMNADRLSVIENVPRDYIDQLMLRLRRAGLVQSRRGAQGGYALAKPSGKISLGMIVRAVEESVFDYVCDRYARGQRICKRTGDCGIRPVWRKLAAIVEAFLDRVTIEQISRDEPCMDARVEMLFASSPAFSKAARKTTKS